MPKSENDSFCSRIVSRVARTHSATLMDFSTWDAQDREALFTTIRHIYSTVGFDISEASRLTRLPVSFLNTVFGSPEFMAFSDDDGAARLRAQLIHQSADRRLVRMLMDDSAAPRNIAAIREQAAVAVVKFRHEQTLSADRTARALAHENAKADRQRALIENERLKAKNIADEARARKARASEKLWVIGGRNDD